MRMLQHVDTGEVQRVESVEGYGPEWIDRGEVPPGIAVGLATWDGTAIVADRAAALVLLRAERDARLRASDWTQLPDVPSANRLAWQPYRQALRDAPETLDPFDPDWPSPPE